LADDIRTEIRDLLLEVRDLLRPIADAYQDDYERRQAERERQRIAAVRELLSSDKRRKAWALADGSRSQREIGRASGMDAGSASRFFSRLRELDALTASSNPERALQVTA
jgi:hypothetical protein